MMKEDFKARDEALLANLEDLLDNPKFNELATEELQHSLSLRVPDADCVTAIIEELLLPRNRAPKGREDLKGVSYLERFRRGYKKTLFPHMVSKLASKLGRRTSAERRVYEALEEDAPDADAPEVEVLASREHVLALLVNVLGQTNGKLLFWTEVEGMPVDVAAKRLQVTLDAAKSRRLRGLAVLKEDARVRDLSRRWKWSPAQPA